MVLFCLYNHRSLNYIYASKKRTTYTSYKQKREKYIVGAVLVLLGAGVTLWLVCYPTVGVSFGLLISFVISLFLDLVMSLVQT